MKNLLFFLILVAVAFLGCDGRKSKSVALKESIEKFNEKQLHRETIAFYPKVPIKIMTDTILSNGVNVRIKNYTLPNEGVLMATKKNNSLKTTTLHRIFTSEIVVSTPSKEIFNTTISARGFKHGSRDRFWDNATLQHVWVNQELSTFNDIALDLSFINPKDQAYKLYRMSIDKNGQQHLDLIEERT